MPVTPIIVQYKKEARVISLWEQGRTTQEIADILSSELPPEVGGINQSSVSRWLKPFREMTREAANEAFQNRVRKKITTDMEGVESIQQFLFSEFADEHKGIKDRRDFGLDYVRVTLDKIKIAMGSGQGGAGGMDSAESRDREAAMVGEVARLLTDAAEGECGGSGGAAS